MGAWWSVKDDRHQIRMLAQADPAPGAVLARAMLLPAACAPTRRGRLPRFRSSASSNSRNSPFPRQVRLISNHSISL